jgi:hypothetical protein
MTRDEFNARLRQDGGFRVRVRMLSEGEGGRSTPISGKSEYRVNWSVGSPDPDRQAGAPMLIDGDELKPGAEATASLLMLFPVAWPDVAPGTRLTAFEGRKAVAEAVVTETLAPDQQPHG